MFKLKIILFALTASILLHTILFFGFKFYINAKLTPYVLMWPEVLDKNYYYNKTAAITPPEKDAFFLQSINSEKSFFLSSLEKPVLEVKKYHEKQVSLFLDDFQNEHHLKKTTESLYLWSKPESLPAKEKEKISYKAFVSPYGKVIFSFPEKLTVSSPDSISSQEYMRQASMFFGDKFFWTKLEAVVR